MCFYQLTRRLHTRPAARATSIDISSSPGEDAPPAPFPPPKRPLSRHHLRCHPLLLPPHLRSFEEGFPGAPET